MKYRVAEAAPRTAMRHRAVYRRGPAAACQEPPCIHHRHTNAAVGAAAVDTPPPQYARGGAQQRGRDGTAAWCPAERHGRIAGGRPDGRGCCSGRWSNAQRGNICS